MSGMSLNESSTQPEELPELLPDRTSRGQNSRKVQSRSVITLPESNTIWYDYLATPT
jgi:hypothetical protein